MRLMELTSLPPSLQFICKFTYVYDLNGPYVLDSL
jgi:hypothetical protein